MDWRDFGHRMAGMAQDLLAQGSVETTLERITGSATELVDGCDASGILLLDHGRARSLAPSCPLVEELDRLQHRLGRGPCFGAARRGAEERMFRIPDLTLHEPRWPDFVSAAQALGVGSMMGFLLFTEDESFGALNIYSRRPGAFSEISEAAGIMLASHAAVALSSARTHAQMQEAVASRHRIGEAMGILMAGRHLTEQQAFDVIRRYSQETNTKLREVARLICERGSL
ncbi:GAF and ANTAR domain-containing protein [Streptomyces rubrogriseus]|uniref:GAF and ANTAR domain-containing protein n=1 Tax=Streptomyces rubrogriseus TaxID=194673 RepID=UPI0037020BB3